MIPPQAYPSPPTSHYQTDTLLKAETILNSENSFFGEEIYHFLVNPAWIITLIAAVIFIMLPLLKIFKKRIFSFCFYLFTTLFWLGIFTQIVISDVNYIGFDILNFQYVFLILLLISVGRAFKEDKYDKYLLINTITALISIIILHLLHNMNILLPYEIWLEKGMPI